MLVFVRMCTGFKEQNLFACCQMVYCFGGLKEKYVVVVL